METHICRKAPPEGGWGYMVAFSLFLSMGLHFGPQPSFGVLYVDFLQSVGASTTSVTSTHSVYFLFYSISGIGYGLILPAVFTSFNGYFARKRATVFLVAASAMGLCCMGYSFLIYTLLESYGFRGTLAVMAAITAHMIYVACSLQPWENHAILQIIPKEEERGQEMLLLRLEKQQDRECNLTESETPKLSEEEHIAGGTHIPNVGGERQSLTFLQIITEFFDLTLLKDMTYVNLIIGISFAEYSVLAFLILQPLYLLLAGWTKEEASICASIIGACDIISKLFLAILNYYYEIKSRNIFLIGTIFSAVGRIVFSFTTSYLPVLFITAFLSFFKSWIFGTVNLIFAEEIPLKQFPAAYGLFMFSHGVIIMILGPIVGYVRDITGSYTISFHLLTVFLMVCIIPWISETIWMKTKSRNNRLIKEKRVIRGCKKTSL